ncbi:hypothetical protein [Lactobacillus agrestimuris]|nr:hypothetical protein [Lactobacillus agrestimuris]
MSRIEFQELKESYDNLQSNCKAVDFTLGMANSEVGIVQDSKNLLGSH